MSLPDAFDDASFRETIKTFKPPRFVMVHGVSGMVEEFRGGYIIEGPEGRVLMLGGGLTDEMFTHLELGMMNITRIQEMTKKERRKNGPEPFPLDETWKGYIAKCDIDESYAAKMTWKRRDDPALFLLVNNGLHLVDGHHRMKRRIRDGLPNMLGYVIDGAILEYTRIGLYKLDGDIWCKVPVTEQMVMGSTA